MNDGRRKGWRMTTDRRDYEWTKEGSYMEVDIGRGEEGRSISEPKERKMTKQEFSLGSIRTEEGGQ